MPEDPDDAPDDLLLLAKDLAVALGIVGGIVVVIFGLTGVWPPVVVVESGSMMHAGSPFGRVGTIDPGDLIFVTKVEGPDDVTSHGAARNRGGPRAYGDLGDVLIFQSPRGPPIIHRAMAWVEVTQTPDGDRRYTVEAYDIHGAESITIQELGLRRYRPNQDGFLTQGDSTNNPFADQALGIVSEPVDSQQIIGKARGEVPWFGLIKLTVAGNPCEDPSWVRILGACAPTDLWVMLGVGLAIVLAIPLTVDQVVLYMEAEGRRPGDPPEGEGPDGEDLSTNDASGRPRDRP